MKKQWLKAAVVAALALTTTGAAAQTFAVAADDTVENVLSAQKGKRVTVMFAQGGELTGTVKLVTREVVHLGELAGKEFYDAAIDTKSVKAVVVRAKN